MFKKNRVQNYPYQQQMPQMNTPQYNPSYPDNQVDRLMYEIKENRRRINNLAKRIVRLENYLRIRDTSDYVMEDDDSLNQM